MIGVIDIGNTNYHCGIFKNNSLTKDIRTAELKELKKFFSGIEQILSISVAPGKKKLVAETVDPEIISFPTNIVEIDYKSEPGEDRLANGLGVKEVTGLPAVVIDCGSAITIDLFSQSTETNYPVKFEGGAIIPGLASYFSSVANAGAKLPKITHEFHNKTGKNTEECIKLGAFGSLVGGIKEILRIVDYKNKNLIFTGGDGKIFSEYFKARYDSVLTLKGGLVAYNEISRRN